MDHSPDEVNRSLMKRAIAAMKGSVAEPRPDGKVSPSVGAVILLPSTAETIAASRGELREGDHAEFTLLERKLRDRDLRGSTLFATLEPCAPGARKSPKLSCAERIVSARVARVWVGIEDPDPTVDRRGIKFLQDHGVDVQMFPPDLQKEIRDFNGSFLQQAMERAAQAEEEEASAKPIRLSDLGETVPACDLTDLSDAALVAWRDRAEMEEKVGSASFQRRMRQLGLVADDGLHLLRPTRNGLLLFGREPRLIMQQAGLLATVHREDGDEESRDFDGPLVGVTEQALAWCRERLPEITRREDAQRTDLRALLLQGLREGIVNALVHRDYEIGGAKCQLTIQKDRIEIRSPGLPVDPIRLEDLQAFRAPMLSRNPLIHFIFRQMGVAEERGLGLKTMRRSLQQAGMPRPLYLWEAPYLVLRMFRSADGPLEGLPEHLLAELREPQIAGLRWLREQDDAQPVEYAEALGVDRKTANRHLKLLEKLGLATRSGATRATRYSAVQ